MKESPEIFTAIGMDKKEAEELVVTIEQMGKDLKVQKELK